MTLVYALLFVASIFAILFLVYSTPNNALSTVLWSIWIPIFLAVRLRRYYALPADRVLELDERQPSYSYGRSPTTPYGSGGKAWWGSTVAERSKRQYHL